MRTRIVETEVWKEDLQLKRSYRIAGEEITDAYNAFIVLRDETGRSGIGAASPMPEVCGEHMHETLTGLNKAAELLRSAGALPLEIFCEILEKELSETPAAWAAVDMALYDLSCKQLGISVVAFLGKHHTAMETSVTIGISSEDRVREELFAHLVQGFRVIKVKIGDNVDRDIAIIHKLREWGGNEFRLRVDANEGYTLLSLKQFMARTAKLNIELIEQPLPSPAGDHMRTLSGTQRAVCMADEDLMTEGDADALSEGTPYGVWNVKLMKSGGITPTKRIAAKALRAGIRVMWGCNDESRISIAAALHVAFSCSATQYLDLDGSFDIAHDIVSGGFVLENGKLRLTDTPGLGVMLL
ncbi:MAG TPA: dipeptide epimerase [Saprospiraceae bacterium]|nr:dipeptide epimerase [Saprospiraceae bacterium]